MREILARFGTVADNWKIGVDALSQRIDRRSQPGRHPNPGPQDVLDRRDDLLSALYKRQGSLDVVLSDHANCLHRSWP